MADDDRDRDLQLAAACAAGDDAAVEAFHRAFGDMIRFIARQAVGPDGAEDLTQQVFARLLVSEDDTPPRIATFTGSGSLRGFVRMAASRMAIDATRAERSRARHTGASDGGVVAPTVDPDVVELEAFQPRLSAALTAAFGSLTTLERRALRMRFVLGFSPSRAARALGVHENSVSRIVLRARQRLMDAIQRDPEMPTHPSDLVALAKLLDVSIARYLESNPDVGASGGDA